MKWRDNKNFKINGRVFLLPLHKCIKNYNYVRKNKGRTPKTNRIH